MQRGWCARRSSASSKTGRSKVLKWIASWRYSRSSVTVPLPAIGYQLPMAVDTPTAAARLAVRMEEDCAVAWRAVLEQTDSEQDRELAGTALTQCAVMAALWRQVLGGWPVTKAFPGGSE